MRARREPASSSTRLYRKRWYSELKARLGGASNLTPAIITALWQFSRDEYFVHPADQRPVVFAKVEDQAEAQIEAEAETEVENKKWRPIELSDLFTDDGVEFLDDIGTAEIIRVDDKFLPRVKPTNKKDQYLIAPLNQTYSHPENGRQRLGQFAPFDTMRFVIPELTEQNAILSDRLNTIAQIVARCPDPNIPIIDQLNAAPDDEDEDPEPGFV